MLRIVGSCDQRLFGLEPAERLRRQRGSAPGPVLVAHASAVLSDAAVHWLIENPGKPLTTPGGRAIAMSCDPAHADRAAEWIAAGAAPDAIDPASLGATFVRKLRRRDTLLVRSLDESPLKRVERELFDTVYKGVTDLVTKYAWPTPAYWATKACARLGIPPNGVTIVGMLLVIGAAWLWLEGRIVAGLALAWGMTFLDTVDGKLARVTATSSKLGNTLDHSTDVIHPPIWWACLAAGLAQHFPASEDVIGHALWVILGGYIVGRVIEEFFKSRIGFNAYLWRPFDSAFRLIVSRRNIILLIMTVGLFVSPVRSFIAAAVWTALSVVIQLVRLVQGLAAARKGKVATWLS